MSTLALKMCAGCTRSYAAEGDVGDEQGGSAWFGPCCPAAPGPPPYAGARVMLRDGADKGPYAVLAKDGRTCSVRRIGFPDGPVLRFPAAELRVVQ